MKILTKTMNFCIMVLLILNIISCSSKGEIDLKGKEKNADSNPDKINSLEKIDLNGVNQWININGNDDTKPVLLFLHGGPGYGMLPILHQNNYDLEKSFVVVNWDQRGAGLSYSDKLTKNKMKFKYLNEDVHILTQYLKKRFNQQKIYIVGHSFGTVLAVNAISKYPEDYWAYVGIGQVVDIIENEKLCYEFALERAKENNETKAINELTKIGKPDSNGEYKDEEGYEITMSWVEYFGGEILWKTGPEEMEAFMQSDPIYKGKKQQLEDGLDFSQVLFEEPEVKEINFRKTHTKFKIPIYIMSGSYDYDTPYKLSKEYFDMIDAPKKEFLWFDYSAHFPFYEQPAEFNDVIMNKVLTDTFKK